MHLGILLVKDLANTYVCWWCCTRSCNHPISKVLHQIGSWGIFIYHGWGCNSQFDCSLALWQVVHHGWKEPLRNQRLEYPPPPLWEDFFQELSLTGTGFWCLPLLGLFLGCDRQSSAATSEPAPTSPPWRMNSKWSGNSFLLGSSSLVNHGG